MRQLLEDDGIVRNRAKIESTLTNARACVETQREFGSFDSYLWRFVDGRPVQNAWKSPGEHPTETEASRVMSRDLRTRGFRFVGPTICYSLMQATGMVNDHEVECFRWRDIARLTSARAQARTKRG